MSTQTPRPSVLIVGCGNIAGGFDEGRAGDAPPLSHVGAFQRDGRFDVAACMDSNRERLREFQSRWAVPDGVAGFDDLDRARRFDVISVCSPTALHSEHLEAALRLQPRLIFCEKPVTCHVQETAEWVTRCDAARVLLAVNHSRRWAPDVERLRDELASGRWGQLRSITGHYNKGLLNNGGHMIDLLHYVLGKPLKLVAAGTPVWDFWDDDPTIPAMLETEDRVPVSLNVGNAADYALFELQLTTSKGVIAMEDGGGAWRAREAVPSPHFNGYSALDSGERSPGDYALAMSNAVGNIYASLHSGAALASTGRSALEAQRLCDHIKSAAFANQEPTSG